MAGLKAEQDCAAYEGLQRLAIVHANGSVNKTQQCRALIEHPIQIHRIERGDRRQCRAKPLRAPRLCGKKTVLSRVLLRFVQATESRNYNAGR